MGRNLRVTRGMNGGAAVTEGKEGKEEFMSFVINN